MDNYPPRFILEHFRKMNRIYKRWVIVHLNLKEKNLKLHIFFKLGNNIIEEVNKHMNKGTIKCDVATCKHNNCDKGCCELNEVKISSTCDGDCCKKTEETICQSFKKAK